MDYALYALVLIIGMFIGKYLPSYLSKKGENLATKEDIAEITQRIEEVKGRYASEIETLRASLQVLNQLRTAAIDKRLDKHQEAYTLWTNLFWSLHGDDKKLTDAIIKCQDWWNNNCLYLDSGSRLTFKKAYLLASDYNTIPNTSYEQKIQWFTEIQNAGNMIVAGVNLPTIGEYESKKAETQTIKPTQEV